MRDIRAYVRQGLGFAFRFEYIASIGRAGMKSGRSVRAGYIRPETRRRSIRPSVESRRYLSFSVSIVNIEVAPDTVNFAAPRQHCWGLKWNAGARRKRYVYDLTKRQERSKCLLTRDVYLPGRSRQTLPRYVFNKMRFENHVTTCYSVRFMLNCEISEVYLKKCVFIINSLYIQ